MKGRLVIVLVLGGLWLAAIGVRLYQVQIGRFEEFSLRAEKQQKRMVAVHGRRGTIYDARGRELAISVAADSVHADPSKVDDPAAATDLLAPILGLDAEGRETLERRLSSDRSFVWIARMIEPEVADEIRALEMEAIAFEKENRRYYPFASTLSHVLGYTGTDSQGLAGLEYQYEEVLAGGMMQRMLVNDGRAGASLVDHQYELRDPEPGRSLHLTVDATLQYVAEKELRKAVEGSRAAAGTVVILDSRDSAVLAMASYPTFDPNRFNDFGDEDRQNRAVHHFMEPGSTFKAVTAAAVFERGVVHPDDLFFCENGAVVLGRTRIGDHKPFGELTFREVIAFSSNVGVIKASQMISDQYFYDTIRTFGFGRRTGIDLPAESPGSVKPVDRWQPLTKAYMSFGHEIAVSSLQLANAFAAVANGGRLNTPYVVRALGSAGSEEVLPRPPAQEVLSPETLATLRSVLEEVVVNGTAKRASVGGYRVAGKTGTAQKMIDGRYSHALHFASFVGMVPARDPRFVGLVMIDEPRTSTHGGSVAAPAFSAIMQQALLHHGVAPDPELWTDDEGWIRPGQGPRVEPAPAIDRLADFDAESATPVAAGLEAGS